MQGRLILVDGSSYLYRAFHGLPPLTTAQGEPSGAVYGVVAMLKKLRKETRAEDSIVVVLDSPIPTFRHELYADYKANRLKMPKELQSQIPALQAIIPAMGFPLVVHPGVEADDIIATLAQQAQEAKMPVLISTNDKDFAQLVNSSVSLVNTMTERVLDRAGVIERFGVTPEQIVDYLSLTGDASDNIAGVPLVGPKTAAKWLGQYGTLENLLANELDITGKVGQNLRAYRKHVLLARTLITIQKDVPLEKNLTDLLAQSQEMDANCLMYWFGKLEFKQWMHELAQPKKGIHLNFTKHDLILDQVLLDKWLAAIPHSKYLVLDLETTSLNTLEAEIVGVGLGLSSQQVAYIPLQHDYIDAPAQLDREKVLNQLKPFLEDTTLKKIGHHLKYDQSVLANYNIHLKGIYADTLLESYLLDSTHKGSDLDTLSWKHLGYRTTTFEAIAGKGKHALSFNQVPLTQAAPYAAEDISVCLALHNILEPQLAAIDVLQLRDTIEIPLISVLSHMERRGVRINETLLRRQSQELAERLSAIEDKTYQLAGRPFNLGSPQQLRAILYEEQQLPILAKTATGQPSTAEKVLQALAAEHALAQLILEYRTLSKLKSTYTDTLPKQIHPKTGRVHTAYHQAIVTTGRLSSSNPNLQNIPIRTEEGRKIRRAFEASPGYKLLAADYSQIELRIMAHFSEDASLLAAFYEERDIHAATAAVLFGVPIEQVNAEQRRRAKAINFGLMYGMSAFGLATQLRTTPAAAQQIMNEYFERYPGVKQYMENTRNIAHKQGYVTTLFGRRLPLPLIASNNRNYQKAAERAAINAPLQGTAADIIKRAMITIDAELTHHAIEAYMIMQVHDELVFEVQEAALTKAKECIEEGMQQAAQLKVPLRVMIGVGNNWDEAH
jgi:DNA polymerase I